MKNFKYYLTIIILSLFTVVAFAQESHLKPEGSVQDSSANNDGDLKVYKRLRVVMSTDFPPVGVVKGGNVPNTQKSDPDDMQSVVRFLLYANEFDIEGLIASAGTFANKAKKQNILDVIDLYEKVYNNLKRHDPLYPTQESWGGQFKKDGDKNHYIDGPGRSSISKWRKDYQKEFAERADWCASQ